jgi:hypothetical protein
LTVIDLFLAWGATYRNRMNSVAAKENLLKQVIWFALNVFQHVSRVRLRIHSQTLKHRIVSLDILPGMTDAVNREPTTG